MSDETRHYCDEALAEAGIEPAADPAEALISELGRMSEIGYQQRRAEAAARLGLRVSVLDKAVRKARARSKGEQAALPHWNVEPWNAPVDGGNILGSIEKAFRRYIVLPAGASVAFALWTLHAWTMDAGDISPFLVLVSPTKRCGKTSALIVLYYLTPKSELASNISASALFRYVEEVRPTLLIDEADSFVKDNEELRGILNSGHTRAAAHVIRNVEVEGEHKPRRFSTWAPKAIATIRALADTLEDRAIVVQLQRKPRAASVARLRKRDSEEFGILRQLAKRWADDNFAALTDPDPAIPESLNDRAADNWRPLIAIADLAGGDWPARARDAARLLSGEGHDSTSVNVELLADIRLAFGNAGEISSADLVVRLTSDPERPWVEWKHGKPLTQQQLAGLLRPFGIIPERLDSSPSGERRQQVRGYRVEHFTGVWEAYCPGQNPSQADSELLRCHSVTKPANVEQVDSFAGVTDASCDGSENADLSLSDGACDTVTATKPGNGGASHSDQGSDPSLAPETPPWEERQISTSPEDRHPPGEHRCQQCRGKPDGMERPVTVEGRTVWLHPQCQRFYPGAAAATESSAPRPVTPPVDSPSTQPSPDPWEEAGKIPDFLRRTTNGANAPALGPPGDTLDDFQ
jgi:putative DNA primase/helicase